MKIKKSQLKELLEQELEFTTKLMKAKEPKNEQDEEPIDQPDQQPEPDSPRSNIEYITPDQAVELIFSAGNALFDVVFVKKDGSLRRMNARRGVKKHLRGGELKYDPREKGLITVFDVQKGQYRSINQDTIKSLRMGGRKFVVRPKGLSETPQPAPTETPTRRRIPLPTPRETPKETPRETPRETPTRRPFRLPDEAPDPAPKASGKGEKQIANLIARKYLRGL